MASKVKGITVEIGGNTLGLKKSLSELDKGLRSTESELKAVERGLKLDPKNIELLKQKQVLLNKEIVDSKTKVEALKNAKKKADEDMKNGTKVNEEQYRMLTREIVFTESSLKKLEAAADDVNTSIKKVSKSTSDSAGATTGAVAAGNLLASGIKSVGSKLLETVESTREYRREIGFLKTNCEQAGVSFDTVNKKLNRVSAITNDSGAAIEGFSNLLQAGFSGDKLDAITDNLVGASIKWKDTLKFEGLADGLQETLATGAATGPFGEMLERLGMDLDVFNAGLTECTTSAEKQQYVLDILTNTGLVDAKREYEETNKALIDNAEANAELNAKMAELAEKIEPLLTIVTGFVIKIIEWINNNPELAATLAAIATVLLVVATSIGAVNAAMAISPVTWIILAIVAAVTALIAVVVLCIKHFEEIKVVAEKVWNGIEYAAKMCWYGIKYAAVTVINLLIDYWNTLAKAILKPVNAIIEALNFIPGIDIKEIKFKIGKLDLPEVPEMATGGILHYGTSLVGEKGPELLTVGHGQTKVTPLNGDYSAIKNYTTNNYGARQQVNVFEVDGRNVTTVIQPRTSVLSANKTDSRRRAGC